jgi:hypothetical protein
MSLFRNGFLLALLCFSAVPGTCAAAQGMDALLQADDAMNRDIMDQGNDIHAMRANMDEMDMAYSFRKSAFLNLHEFYKYAPTGPTPGNILFLHTGYAITSAAEDLGVTSGVWNAEVVSDSKGAKVTPDLFYSGFVFGFNAGLWTAKWSPRGAPRWFYNYYVRVWRRAGGTWRLVGGPFFINTPVGNAHSRDEPLVTEAASPQIGRLQLAAARSAGLDGDGEFSGVAQQQGLHAAYVHYAADDIHLLRTYETTIVGSGALKAETSDGASPLRLHPLDAIAAASGDLSYTYGFIYAANDAAYSKPLEIYAHVWRHAQDGWKLVLAVVSPLQGYSVEKPK